ncbi:serine/threonine dehydratase [Nonomuraea glycinis]|uniref:threonine ammonia-lyase n=1 Tax=Nonomuraea glycinis TaxID=2047744 RepID=A0A918EAG7_9ACTN|nr:serine/threonine dehydratase [Nonomuraea glycinis]MCA2182791.1 serine/threonine dehydratase [Nonomuraea glycinis]GGP17189.1 threonine dehydratase [Nonomuraea glycinis]
MIPTDEDLAQAHARLRTRVRHTPVLHIDGRDVGSHGTLTLKLEQLQHTGSFKARGALNAVLTMPTAAASVTAASGGNHGAAVAWAARQAGVHATIFVPSFSPQVKQDAIRRYGADLHLVDGFYADALEASRRYAADREAIHVDAYDQAATVAGQSTIGVELAEQIPPGEVVIVSCGGGGLFAGVCLALRGRNTVIAAEPETAPSLASAIAAGRPVDIDVDRTGVAVDSLGARRAGAIATAVALDQRSAVLLAPDRAIRQAQQQLWDNLRIAVEPGGATALAAALHHARDLAGHRITVLISGANS